MLKFLSYAPLLFISAKTGRNVEKVFPKIDAIVEGYRRKFRTSELNTVLERAVSAHQPGRRARQTAPLLLRHAAQIRARRPSPCSPTSTSRCTFPTNATSTTSSAKHFDLVGCPIHLIIRARKGMKKESRR